MTTTSHPSLNLTTSSPPRPSRGPALKIDVDSLTSTSSSSSRKMATTASTSRVLQQQQQQQQQRQDYTRAQDAARDIMEAGPEDDGQGRRHDPDDDENEDEDAIERSLRRHPGGAGRYEGEEDIDMDQEDLKRGGQPGGLRYVDEDGHQDHDDHEGDEENLDDGGSFSDSLSSSPSIPDEDIDFTLVYALHTFLATVDGQASVVKGDKLLLLDDSNSYWWLVRVLKTQAVGYIPAENIETPWERLARLNKHLNVDLTSATQQDILSGPMSTLAQTRFQTRIPPSQQPHPHVSQHPSAKGVIASPTHKDHPRNISPPPNVDPSARSASAKAKTVGFTAPTYYEHSANGQSEGDEYDDEYDEDDEGLQHHQDEMDEDGEEMRGDQMFDDHDDEAEESEFSDEELDEEGGNHSTLAERSGVISSGIVGGAVVAGGAASVAAREANVHAHEGQVGEIVDENVGGTSEIAKNETSIVRQETSTPAQKRTLSPHDLGNLESGALSSQLRALNGSLNQEAVREADATASNVRDSTASLGEPTSENDPFARRPSLSDGSIKGREVNLKAFEPDAPTKKLTATPPIVRDPSFDINDPFGEVSAGGASQSPRAASPIKVRGVEVVNPSDPRYNRLIGPVKRLQEETQRSPHASPSSPTSPTTASVGDYGRGGEGRDGDASMNSMDTTSSYVSGFGASEEGGARATTPTSVNSNASGSTSGNSKAKNKNRTGSGGRDLVEGDETTGGKKRKTGGILGLFRKKDKKKKGGSNGADDGDVRSSEESARTSPILSTSSPKMRDLTNGGSSRRESQTADTLFSTDAALRQQQVEAKQALYHQYGVQRAPGDVSNTMTPRSRASSIALSPNNSLQSATPARMRPGSLLASPSIPGLDVPLLSVLRVFAGENVDSEATFKTVLLNRSTTTPDLVKQAMQRFRLTGDAEIDEYYLTVRELGGDERVLGEHVRPLAVFESLSEQTEHGFVVPSVKRSSVGSVNSIQSNLSLNPAITRLGMNDWSDDSAVKFYLHRSMPEKRSAHSQPVSSDAGSMSSSPAMKDAGATHSLPPPISTSGPVSNLLAADLPVAASPSFRFAVRIVIHPQDLPENVVFDPQSNAIIPRSILGERHQRGGVESEPISPDVRERIVFFPRNVTVSDVIEAGLDRFGIIDGVVDGGDEVEDRVSKRRSVSRVKYALAVGKDGHEILLSSSGKLIDSYSTPPLLKPYDRTSKEFRRRSVDATLILGSEHDIQPTDPIFVLRRAAYRGPATRSAGPVPATIDELEERQQKRAFAEQQVASDPSTSRGAAAAAAAAATQQARSMLSARQNDEQGVDIAIPDRGTIRSARVPGAAGNRVRYSFIGPNGHATDISDLVDSEFASPSESQPDSLLHPSDRSVSRSSRLTNNTTTDAESFHTAQEGASLYSNGSTASTSTLNAATTDSEDESNAVQALRSTDVTIDGPSSSSSSTPTIGAAPAISRSLGAASALRQAASAGHSPRLGATNDDVLQGAFGSRRAMSPAFNESLQERLDRVLAQVKEDKLRGRASPALRPPSRVSDHTRASGSSTPTVRATSSTLGVSQSGRRSPPAGASISDSPSIDQVVNSPSPTTARAPSSASRHGRTLSSGSNRSSTTDHASASTPITSSGGHGGNRAITGHAGTATNARSTSTAGPAPYRDDFGLETMLAIVDGQSRRPPRTSSLKRPQGVETLFGPSMKDLNISSDVRMMYEPQTRKLDELEARLDALLLRLKVPNPASTIQPTAAPYSKTSPQQLQQQQQRQQQVAATKS